MMDTHKPATYLGEFIVRRVLHGHDNLDNLLSECIQGTKELIYKIDLWVRENLIKSCHNLHVEMSIQVASLALCRGRASLVYGVQLVYLR